MTWTKIISNQINTETPSAPINVATQQINTFNMFDKSLQANLTTSPQDTHLMPVKEGRIYTWNTNTNATYTVFDENQTALTSSTSLSAKIPTGGRYLSVKVYGGESVLNTLMVVEGTYRYTTSEHIPFKQETIITTLPQGFYRSKWYGKSWWVLGDSISTGNGNKATNTYANMPYHYLLAHERFIKVTNDSTSGYTIGNIYDNKVINMPPTENAPDLITIMAGTNDHGFQTSIGTIDDLTTGTTFYARYKKTIEFLLNRYPNTTIGLITPIKRVAASLGYTDQTIRGGATLEGFCEAVHTIGKYYSVPTLDLFHNLGFSPHNVAQNTLYFVNEDGTHPNDLGHVPIAARVGNFIERI